MVRKGAREAAVLEDVNEFVEAVTTGVASSFDDNGLAPVATKVQEAAQSCAELRFTVNLAQGESLFVVVFFAPFRSVLFLGSLSLSPSPTQFFFSPVFGSLSSPSSYAVSPLGVAGVVVSTAETQAETSVNVGVLEDPPCTSTLGLLQS